jgi:hypothetical protein
MTPGLCICRISKRLGTGEPWRIAVGRGLAWRAAAAKGLKAVRGRYGRVGVGDRCRGPEFRRWCGGCGGE